MKTSSFFRITRHISANLFISVLLLLHSFSAAAAQSEVAKSGEPALAKIDDKPSPPPPASLSGMRRLPANGPGLSMDRSLILEAATPEPVSDDRLPLAQVPSNLLIPVGKEKLSPILLEASYTEGITLKRALEMARQNNLRIKISQTYWRENQFKYFGSFGRFLPTFSLDFIRTSTTVNNSTSYSTPLYLTTIFPVFMGGASLFNMLQTQHEMKAAGYASTVSINDILLDVYVKYYDLILNSALLQVKSKAVEVSEAQLRINRDLKTAGLGTDFEVMQSSTLLALDRQRLVRQEVATRQAALRLAVALNLSVVETLLPSETAINRLELIDPALKPEMLTALAIENRPELSRYEQLRLAARNATKLEASALLPNASFFTNNAINIANGGDTIVIPTGGAANTGGITSGNAGNANSAFSAGFILNWLLAGAGVENAANIGAARLRARRAVLEAQESLLQISAQVREAYLDSRAAETDIEVSSEAVKMSSEEIRMADLRLRHQLGTNLELIQAQKDYVEALSKRIEAFVNYKQSQAKLLHAIGLVSIENLTSDHAQHFELHKSRQGR